MLAHRKSTLNGRRVIKMKVIGIRREDKNRFERRTPLIPRHVKELREKYGIRVLVQPSAIRVFSDDEYRNAGAIISEDLTPADIIFAVKEIPEDLILPKKVYIYFSHTTKCQPYNMAKLKKIIENRCTLIDYEKITDENHKRLIFFGKHAGLAGMIETLWALGKRLAWKGIITPFTKIKHAYEYEDLAHAKSELAKIAHEIKERGLPSEIKPLIIGITGYGNVSHGALEILDIFPTKEIPAEKLAELVENNELNEDVIYKVILRHEHQVRHKNSKKPFDKYHYYANPHEYDPILSQYLPYLTVLVNGIYWEPKFPRLVTIEEIKQLHRQPNFRLEIIGDITCDINGSIELTVKPTTPDNPVYVFNPDTETVTDGYEGDGIVIMAVDNLPAEISKDASIFFSNALVKFVPELVNTDFSVSFENLDISEPIKKAIIVYNGKLTPQYQYLKDCLSYA